MIDVRRRRVDDPDERCPPVAHRLSRLGHDEFREPATRNAVEFGGGRRRDAGLAWTAASLWRQSSGVATLYQGGIRRCGLTMEREDGVERGWVGRELIRRSLEIGGFRRIVLEKSLSFVVCLFVKNNIFVTLNIVMIIMCE